MLGAFASAIISPATRQCKTFLCPNSSPSQSKLEGNPCIADFERRWVRRTRQSSTRIVSYPQATHRSAFRAEDSPFSVIETTTAQKILRGLSEQDRRDAEIDCAHGILRVLHDAFEVDEAKQAPRVLFICGPGFAGRAALRCAAMIASEDRESQAADAAAKQKVVGAVVFDIDFVTAAAETRHEKLVAFCRESGVQVMNFFPRTFALCFDLVVEALEEVDIPSPMLVSRTRSLVTESLATSRVPIVSVDIPAGWDPNSGPPAFPAQSAQPNVLISLGAPKEGTRSFRGAFHYLAGKFLFQKFLEQGELSNLESTSSLSGHRSADGGVDPAHSFTPQLPQFPKHSAAVLLAANPREFGWGYEPDEYALPESF